MQKKLQQQVKNLNAVELMNFVSDKYHTSEKRNLSSLNQCFLFMPETDKKQHPEINTVRSHFNEIRKLLQKHLSDSETVYFPAIKKGVNTHYDFSGLRKQAHSTREDTTRHFHEIQRLTHGYTPPPDASGWMKLCYALLNDLESDTNHHLFVEESILPLKLGA